MALQGVVFAYHDRVMFNRYKMADSLSGASIPAYQNHLEALESCKTAALAANRPGLVPLLNPSFRNTWMNLIPLYAESGDRKAMLHAFSQSMKYGFTLGAVRLLLQSLPRSFQRSSRAAING